MNFFISYHFGVHETFIAQVCHYLRKQNIKTYFHKHEQIPLGIQDWQVEIYGKLEEADAILFFQGDPIGKTQQIELDDAIRLMKPIILITFPDTKTPIKIRHIREYPLPEDLTDDEALRCARFCAEHMNHTWIPEDDIPEGYPFDYEKKIIQTYLNDNIPMELISQGCPDKWPTVTRRPISQENIVPPEKIGNYRDDLSVENASSDLVKPEIQEGEKGGTMPSAGNPEVLAAAISEFEPNLLIKRGMVFPLAGPRRMLHFPPSDDTVMKVGILVSGGIAPGTNAVISAIRQRHQLYADELHCNVNVFGYFDGFQHLLSTIAPRELDQQVLEEGFNRGGSIIGTSRENAFMHQNLSKRDNYLNKAVNKLQNDGIDILYIIGGDGSMRAAHVLWKKITELISEEEERISIVAIPKTMDNDVLWTWRTFGFESAVERANDIIHQLHVEVQSNPRLCVLQLFGSDSGHVVTQAILSSGVCDLFLIPEVPFTMRKITQFICGRLYDTQQANLPIVRSHGLILAAEAAIPLDANWYMDEPEYKLTIEEKEAVRDHLRLDYWTRDSLSVPEESAWRIRQYLGIFKDNDLKVHKDQVQPIKPEDMPFLLEFAKHSRTPGQTPDDLRSAGLKLISKVLEKSIRSNPRMNPRAYWKNFRVLTNEPRHLIRAIAPTSSDILLSQRLGTLAVDGAMAGYTDFMISQWLPNT